MTNEIDARRAVLNWLQGDCVVDCDYPFVFGIVPDSDDKSLFSEGDVEGFVVVTQTCDIVRSQEDRPYMEVCGLVKVAPEKIDEIMRGRMPRFAYIEGVAGLGLVADLDYVMTVEKAVVATWERRQGCFTDEQRRQLAHALGRKRSRTAFPDKFVKMMRPLQTRIQNKHNRESAEGAALRDIREIRVGAKPNWSSSKVEVLIWFIVQPGVALSAGKRADLLEWAKKWLSRVQCDDQFCSIDPIIASLEDMTALEYLQGDQLDFDYLSES